MRRFRCSASTATLIAAFAGLILLSAGGASANSEAQHDLYRLCTDRIQAAEASLTIPAQLLHAISVVESGRWDDKLERQVPWPWTIYAENRGRVFSSKAAAIKEIKKLQARGVRSIDVGCMQVNLAYHGDAFDSLDEALDPAHNVAYAARYLKDLYQDTRSWQQAVARYHSSTPKLARPYRVKVIRAWNEARRDASEDRRLAQLEKRRALKAERARQRAARQGS